jgi:hypothetical protein
MTEERQEFDLKVHSVDSKTGKLTKKNPYRLICNEKGWLFERPPHSGIFYSQGGEVMDSPELRKQRENRK